MYKLDLPNERIRHGQNRSLSFFHGHNQLMVIRRFAGNGFLVLYPCHPPRPPVCWVAAQILNLLLQGGLVVLAVGRSAGAVPRAVVRGAGLARVRSMRMGMFYRGPSVRQDFAVYRGVAEPYRRLLNGRRPSTKFFWYLFILLLPSLPGLSTPECQPQKE